MISDKRFDARIGNFKMPIVNCEAESCIGSHAGQC